MPYKDPEKRREMMRLTTARYRTTEKGKAALRPGACRRSQRWRATEAGRAADTQKRERQRLAGKERARTAVRVALGAGRLSRSGCIVCGSDRLVHAHHFLGYEPEHWLDVEWLCPVHHMAAHRVAPIPAPPVTSRETP